MSRVGKKSIEVPSGVKISLNNRQITVEGAKGTLNFEHRPELTVTWDEGEKSVSVAPAAGHEDSRQAKALWGTTRSIIQNMIDGVTKGYEKKLEVVGVGWNAQLQGQQVKLNVGFANAVMVDVPTGVNVTVEKQMVTVSGADKQAVGQLAAVLRSKRPPEPYNGKGVKYADEVIRRKSGKAFGS
ncbi:MAG: 50S ribosomal protein L6 [Phycisphaerales bacterium]|nr:MAG: 50S ribosomal protein L6 [Phycisphaerales bacterium]